MPDDQDSCAWAQAILNARDSKYATISYRDAPKLDKYMVFVPSHVSKAGPQVWFKNFGQTLWGYYGVKKGALRMLRVYDEKDKEGKLSGHSILFAVPPEEIQKVKKWARVGLQKELIVFSEVGRFELRPKGQMMIPFSEWARSTSRNMDVDMEDEEGTEEASGAQAGPSGCA